MTETLLNVEQYTINQTFLKRGFEGFNAADNIPDLTIQRAPTP